MSTKTKDALDKAFREHMQDSFGEDAAIITHWVLVAAGLDANGDPRLLTETLDDNMPMWQIRGLLNEGLIRLDESDEED